MRVFPAIFRKLETVDRDMSRRHSDVPLFFADVIPSNALLGHIEYHAELLREGNWQQKWYRLAEYIQFDGPADALNGRGYLSGQNKLAFSSDASGTSSLSR